MRSSRNESSSKALWIAGLVVLLAAGGGIAWLLTSSDSPPVTPPAPVQRPAETPVEDPEFHNPVAPATTEAKPIELTPVVVRPLPNLPATATPGGPTGCLEGIAVDAQNLPVADVQISLYLGNALLTGAFPGTRQAVDATAVTEANGTFRLCDVPVGRNYVVVGEHEEFARSEASGLMVEKDSVTSGIVLRMSDGAVIHGVVSQLEGGPITGARVELYYTLDMAFLKPDEQKPWKVTFTDGQGRYAFTHVSGSSIRIRAAAESYASQTRSISYALEVAPKDQEVNFELDTGTSMPGRVVSRTDGGAIAGARVEVTSLEKDSPSNSVAISDEGGYFLLEGMGRGTYQLQATADGYSTKTVPGLDLNSGNYTVMMDRQGGVNGWVTSLKGTPVTAFSLYLMKAHPGGEANYLNEHKYFEAEDGRFDYGNLDPGDYVLEARADDYADARSEPFTIAGDSSAVPQIRIRMGKGGTLKGHVFDAEGKALAGALISVNENNFIDSSIAKIFKAIAPSDEREVRARSGPDGAYTLPNITPGTFQVVAEHESSASRVLNDVRVVDDDAGGNAPLDLKLPRGARIEGRAVDDGSSPLPFCKVQISQQQNGYMDSGTTDRDGFFRFANLREGNYQITINPERVGEEPIHPFIRLVYAQKSMKEVYVGEGQIIDGVLIQLKKS